MNVIDHPKGLYRYIVDHDMGFAPNPFFGVCTLACCKPKIRKKAQLGDIVVGYGSKKGGNRGQIVYWMEVARITDFQSYWEDPAFQIKRPRFGTSLTLTYGDNIYHKCPTSGVWIQEKSFHSDPNSLLGLGNLRRDTKRTQNVLVGHEFAYWGGSGPIPPARFKLLMKDRVREVHKIEDRQLADDFINWLTNRPERGYVSEPAMWSRDKRLKSFSAVGVGAC